MGRKNYVELTCDHCGLRISIVEEVRTAEIGYEEGWKKLCWWLYPHEVLLCPHCVNEFENSIKGFWKMEGFGSCNDVYDRSNSPR